jgi:hypothetical protein
MLPPSRTPDFNTTWAVLLLPYLEQQNLYALWDLNQTYFDQTRPARETPVKTYFCPSRRSPDSAPRLSLNGDEPILESGDDITLGKQVPGALGDYAVSIGTTGMDTD